MEAPSLRNPADLLPKATYYFVVHSLRTLLPAPPTDSPEDTTQRNRAAIAHVASLLPANADEAHLAVQYVAAGEWALDCLRLARAHPNDTAHVLQCARQSASMSRQAQRWRVALEHAQTAKRLRESSEAGRDAAKAVEQRAAAFTTEASLHAPPAPAPAETAKPDVIAEAERYALHHRKRAMLIRRLRRLPDKIDLGGLTPEVAHVIATGTTPILRALDEKPHRTLPLAA